MVGPRLPNRFFQSPFDDRMPTILDVLKNALNFHQAGNLDEAQRLYREVLSVQPTNADAWHLLGHVAFARGDLANGIDQVRRAIQLDGGQASFHQHLAEMYLAAGRPGEAEACSRTALSLQPDAFMALYILGAALLRQRHFAPAIESMQRATALRPDFALAHLGLGTALRELGDTDAAIAELRHALRLDANLALAEINLGAALLARGELIEAAVCCRRGVQLQPNLAEGHCALGVILQKQGQLDQAMASYQQALRLNPESAEVYNNLGTIHRSRHEYARALEYYQRALEFRPNFADALTNVGHVYKVQGHALEAGVCYDQSLRIDPHHAMARYSRAVMLLAAGDWERGWSEYESRFSCEGFGRRAFVQPRWSGEPLAGRTLLVHAEQALGDAIQFARFIALLERFDGPVVFEIPATLEVLFKQAGFRNLVARNQTLPHFDVHLPLLSAPQVLGTTLETIPASVPYLSADPRRIEFWRRELGATETFRVGIAWQGNPGYLGDRLRSIPLRHFRTLARPGVELVSLQKGVGTEQLNEIEGQFAVRNLGPQLDTDTDAGPFMDTAAIMMNLDLVITSDTAVAHLAGALGVPVWVALPLSPDWRWLDEREDSPWYPTMRLFRQSHFDDWTEMFAEIGAALQVEAAMD
jgi:tetratricopeptide (TPR) repeat protein